LLGFTVRVGERIGGVNGENRRVTGRPGVHSDNDGADVAPLGTVVAMVEAFQVGVEAALPLNVTVPVVVPKLAPLIVTDVPTGPDAGVRLVMVGEVEVTVKLTMLLGTPATVTTTPRSLRHSHVCHDTRLTPSVTVGAVRPANLTVLEPWLKPKFVPVIVTGVPIGHLLGLNW